MRKIISKRSMGIIMSFLIVMCIGTISIDVKGETAAAEGGRLLPIYSVHMQDKKVALTFDCAWGAEDIPEILEILESNQVKASFFLVGDWVREHPEAAKLIADAGHDIANHSDRHPHVTQMDKEAVKKDIHVAHNTIKEITGVDANLYRPPYGEYNNTVIEAANECNYYTIQWNVDSLDWKEYGRQAMIDKVLTHKNLVPGSIVLLHNSTDYTKDALDDLIKGLKSKGYTLVPVSELIMRDNYELDHAGRQHKIS